MKKLIPLKKKQNMYPTSTGKQGWKLCKILVIRNNKNSRNYCLTVLNCKVITTETALFAPPFFLIPYGRNGKTLLCCAIVMLLRLFRPQIQDYIVC